MFETLYTYPVAKAEEKKTVWVLEALFHHYKEHMDLLPDYLLRLYERGESLDRVVCDYIAGMTDQYAVAKFQEYFIPKSWQMS